MPGLPENPQNFGSSVNGTPIFLDSGRYQARYFHLVGVETVYQAGPFSFQSEWMATVVNSNYAGPIFYNGAVPEVMYRLTGEHREYDKKQAALRNVIPFTNFFSLRGPQRGIYGWGAWQIVSRPIVVCRTTKSGRPQWPLLRECDGPLQRCFDSRQSAL